MKGLRISLAIGGALLSAALLAMPASAASSNTPPAQDDKHSVIVRVDDFTKEINTYKVPRYGINVHFILPKSWELVEEGRDKKTGKVRDDIPVYVVISRAPVAHPEDPTNCIFELDVYQQGLTSDMAAGTADKARQEERGKRFWDFLNEQISLNTKLGNKLSTPRGQIEAKPYGGVMGADGKYVGKPGRPVQYFVPLHYDIAPKGKGSKGTKLFTFNTFTGDTIWQLKFLVTKDQVDNFGGLITIVLDNSFGLTDAVMKQVEQEMKEHAAKSGDKPKNK